MRTWALVMVLAGCAGGWARAQEATALFPFVLPWDDATGRLLWQHRAANDYASIRGPITAGRFWPGGRQVAVGVSDGTIFFFDGLIYAGLSWAVWHSLRGENQPKSGPRSG